MQDPSRQCKGSPGALQDAPTNSASTKSSSSTQDMAQGCQRAPQPQSAKGGMTSGLIDLSLSTPGLASWHHTDTQPRQPRPQGEERSAAAFHCSNTNPEALQRTYPPAGGGAAVAASIRPAAGAPAAPWQAGTGAAPAIKGQAAAHGLHLQHGVTFRHHTPPAPAAAAGGAGTTCNPAAAETAAQLQAPGGGPTMGAVMKEALSLLQQLKLRKQQSMKPAAACSPGQEQEGRQLGVPSSPAAAADCLPRQQQQQVPAAVAAGAAAATPAVKVPLPAPPQPAASPAAVAAALGTRTPPAPTAVGALTSTHPTTLAAAMQSQDQLTSDSDAPELAAGGYQLLSLCPLLPPSLRRAAWTMSPFKLRGVLHQGYASRVIKAAHPVCEEDLVVKVYTRTTLQPLHLAQLLREVGIHSKAVHRHILQLMVAFQDNQEVVLVQPYAAGGDLLKLLRSWGGTLGEREAVRGVVGPLLQALVYLHSHGILHRDIKPENILYDGDGVLKLADFGLAIDLTQESAVTRAGTVLYMAPEVLRCPLKAAPEDNKDQPGLHYTTAADIWALGCLAYEVLTGAPPFMAADRAQVAANVQSMVVKVPGRVSEEGRSFITSCLQREAVNRPTAAALLRHPWVRLHA